MLVVMKNNATEEQVQVVIQTIVDMGFQGIPIPGAQRTAICIVGNKGQVEESKFLSLAGVKETVRVTKPYKLVSRETHVESTVISIGDVRIGFEKRGNSIVFYRALDRKDIYKYFP